MKALLFDLDGTLVDTERESAEAMARALVAGQGVTVDQADRDFVIGRSWVAIYERLAARYTLGWSRDELIAATAAAREGVFAELGITVLPGAREAVHRFAGRGRALVTGSSRVEARQALTALGLVGAFAPVIAAEDVPRSKPSPDGYLAALATLGVAPEDAAVIEDSAAGIAAGRAAGCTVIAVRAGNFAGQDQAAAHAIVDTLDEVTDELLRRVAAARGPDYGRR